MTVTSTFSVLLGTDTIIGDFNSFPQAAALESGKYAIESTNQNDQPAFTFFEADGTATTTITSGQFTDVAIAGRGDMVLAVGVSGGLTIPAGHIGYNTYTADGFGSGMIDLSGAGDCSNADIASRDFGNSAAVWQRNYGGTDNDIFLSIRTSAGANVTTFAVDTSAANDQNASVAYLDDGGIAVAWNRIDASGHTSIWYATYNGDGSVRTAAATLDGVGTVNGPPDVSARSAGGFAIAWEDNETGNSEINTYNFSYNASNQSFHKVTNLPDPDQQAKIADLQNIYGVVFAHTILDGGEVRARDIDLAITDPFTGASLTDPQHPLVIVANEYVNNDPTITGLGRGQFVVSYGSGYDGQVHVQRGQLVETITGDGGDNNLSSISGSLVHIDGGGGDDSLYDSDFNDRLLGNVGNDTLYDGRGDDYLDGGAGNNTVRLNSASTVNLATTGPQNIGQDGMDTFVNIQNLIGSYNADTLIGNSQANILDDGGSGGGEVVVDTLIGGGGNDTYFVSDTQDHVIETSAADGNADLVEARASFTLPDFVENLTLLYNYDIDGTGNGLANIITGSTGINVLTGLGGNDQYYVQNAGDSVHEAVGGGSDRVLTTVNYQLTAGAEIELFTTTNTAGTGAINLIGNEFAQTIGGNNGANIIDGLGGADTMQGFGGNDLYYVDNAGDRVIEAANGGSDTVLSSISYVLTAGQEVEILATTDFAGTTAINLTGNAFAQTIQGNYGANIINGGGDADTMVGFGGNDIYYVDNALDTVSEAAGAGSDRVYSAVSYVLTAGAEIELLMTNNTAGTGAINLTGNEFAQAIYGNAGANVIDGKVGVDTMYGLGGNDTYYVDNVGDRVIEAANGGADRVLSSVSYALTAGAQVETLTTTLTAGTGAINLTGNEFAQTIGGNAGANVIDGKGGADTMYGYGGNDIYYVDNALDKTIEAANGGADRVLASVNYTLTAGAQIETFTTTNTAGTAGLSLIGNEFGQTIAGDAGANLVDGKAGADTLYGYSGRDVFSFTAALGATNIDTVADFSVADDTILLAHAIFTGLGTNHMIDASDFVKGAVANAAHAQVIYNSTTGNLYFDDDGTGGHAQQQFAHLAAGLTTMTNADFYVA